MYNLYIHIYNCFFLKKFSEKFILLLVISRIGSVLGNTQLEKWSTSSIRRAGLCVDHFTENSFKGEGKKLLKRGLVPIPFKNIILSKENNKDVDMESMSIAVEVTDKENNKCNGSKKER